MGFAGGRRVAPQPGFPAGFEEFGAFEPAGVGLVHSVIGDWGRARMAGFGGPPASRRSQAIEPQPPIRFLTFSLVHALRVYAFRTRPGVVMRADRAKTIAGAGMMIAAVLVFYISLRQAPPKVDPRPEEALGQVLA